MLLQTLFVTLAVLLFLYYWFKNNSKKINVPGPNPLFSLPYIGHGYLLAKDPIKTLHKQRETHGDVFRLDTGDKPTVFICGWKLIDEAAKSESFSGRPYEQKASFETIRKRDSKGQPGGTGVSSGPVWHEQRRFMMQNLNDLGMGNKDTMEAIIVQEAEYLVGRMKRLTEQKINIKRFFLTTTNNIIWRLVTGKRTKQDDPELVDLTSRVTEAFKAMDPGSIRNLLQLSSMTVLNLSRFLGIPNIIDTLIPLRDKLQNEIDVNRDDPGGEGYYIQRCWAELDKRKNEQNSSFYGKDGRIHVFGQMFDIFLAGTDTVSTLLEWSILYMCQYPDIQERIHNDIKECLGIDGSISLEDIHRLPFVEAVSTEVARHCPGGALLIPHSTTADTTISGHLIPKGTQIFFFADTVHKDPVLFPNPYQFNPERFMDENRFKKSEHVIIFGHGKRRCVGERLGRAESFLLLSTLLQKFKFAKAREDQVLDFEPLTGAIFNPKPFDIIVEERI